MNKLKTQSDESSLIEAIRILLTQGIAQTQDDIKQNLEAQGYKINQSKISRVLRKLGATKVVDTSGEIVYRLPWEPLPPMPHTSISHLALDVVHNETTIIVYTSPGAAALIARLLDFNAEKIGNLGSIAGDDTVLVVPKSIKNIEETYTLIKNLLFG